MSSPSTTMIETKIINSLTEELAYVSKLHIQNKIAADIIAAELKIFTNGTVPFYIQALLECDVFTNYNIEKYTSKLVNAVGICHDAALLDGRSPQPNAKSLSSLGG